MTAGSSGKKQHGQGLVLNTQGNAWVWGCGIGCVVVLAIGAVVTAATYWLASTAMQEGQVTLREELVARSADMKETGKVPAEQ